MLLITINQNPESKADETIQIRTFIIEFPGLNRKPEDRTAFFLFQGERDKI